MQKDFPITEHMAKGDTHSSFYLACGAADAPLIIFLHGWPELSISWRHQLPVFAALGFRAIAPDMRGYGRSTIHSRHEDYALEHSVSDMLRLLDSLGREQALWVGHDWGSPVVWSLASHHPARCAGIANLCVPYMPNGFSPRTLLPLVVAGSIPKSNSQPANGTISSSTKKISTGPAPASRPILAQPSAPSSGAGTRRISGGRRVPRPSGAMVAGSAASAMRRTCRSTLPS